MKLMARNPPGFSKLRWGYVDQTQGLPKFVCAGKGKQGRNTCTCVPLFVAPPSTQNKGILFIKKVLVPLSPYHLIPCNLLIKLSHKHFCVAVLPRRLVFIWAAHCFSRTVQHDTFLHPLRLSDLRVFGREMPKERVFLWGIWRLFGRVCFLFTIRVFRERQCKGN